MKVETDAPMKSPRKKHYRLTTNDRDPTLHVPLSPELIKDLVKRSKENGRSVEIEIAMRIARSLEEVEILDSDLQNIQEQIALSEKLKKIEKPEKPKSQKGAKKKLN